VRFEIWDTGRGIAPDDLQRIFEEYVQLDNPQRDRRRGLGLGLAIARRSVALLNARIDVASRPGRGSRFRFAQPLFVGTGWSVGGGSAPRLGVLRRGADPVLLVEDDEDVRTALCDLLSRWGIEHRVDTDAESALQRFTSDQRFSLLITDQRLPGDMTGIHLIRAMRQRVADPPPALIVTGEIEPLLREAEAAGIVLLQKPVRAAQLRCVLGA
jgi:CheY-like chemotaxis protein